MDLYNRTRSRKLSYLHFLNRERKKKIVDHITTNHDTMETPTKDILERMAKNIGYCANFSAYGENISTGDLKYISSVFCGNKTCAICNSVRQKGIRRKYKSWFENNQYLIRVANKKGTKVITKAQLVKYQEKGYHVINEVIEYDLMHLTLTVPHYAETGFKGELYYFKTIMELYKYLRRECGFWDNYVLGGEFGVETTSGHWVRNKETKQHEYREQTNGLNIHIHSLLLVERSNKNRNFLHLEILKHWNRLTVDENNPRAELTPFVKNLIKKSNNLITDNYVNELNPKGTTLINLETIFTINANGAKVRTTEFGSEAMIKAVMEAISYHFEPHCFDKHDKSIDIELLSKIIQHIYGERLYSKFGCLYGEKSLNISDSIDDLKSEFKEVAEMLINEDTGEMTPSNEYFLLPPQYVIHDKANDYKLYLSKKGKEIRKKLNAVTTEGAVMELSEIVRKQFKK